MANMKYSDKHNMVAFLKKPVGSDNFHQIVDFLRGTSLRYALTHNPTIYDSLVKQFWQTATVRTIANRTQELVASIDSKEYIITEVSVRSSLQLADAVGIHNLSGAEIHEGLSTMGAAQDQGEGSAYPVEPLPTPGPTPTIAADEATTTRVEVETEGATTTTTGLESGLDSGNIHESPLRSHEAPIHEGHTSGSPKDKLKLQELMDIIPKLVTKVDDLEKELHQTKQTNGKDDEEPEDHGRKNQDIDDDPLVSLVREFMKEKDKYFVTPTKISASGEAQESDISPIIFEAAKTLSQVTSQTVSTYKRRTRSTDKGINISSSIEAEAEVNTGFEDVNTGSIGVSTSIGPISTPSVVQTTNVIILSPVKSQREGKAPMTTEDTPTRRKKAQILQEKVGLAEALRVQAQLDEETAKQVYFDALLAKRMAEEEELSEQQKKRKSQVQFEAQYYTEED
ncbi:hypothetical protein Tco_1411702 [Tanacetum coccineum]